jgi:hypothetical protein
MAVFHARDDLTERRGTYFYRVPSPITAPDTSVSMTSLGIVAGGDVLFPISPSALSIFGGARLYWTDRSTSDAGDRTTFVPTTGGRVLSLVAGVRWN